MSYVSDYATMNRAEDQAETWAFLRHDADSVIENCSNADLKAKVKYLTEILDKSYSTFDASRVPWASILK